MGSKSNSYRDSVSSVTCILSIRQNASKLCMLFVTCVITRGRGRMPTMSPPFDADRRELTDYRGRHRCGSHALPSPVSSRTLTEAANGRAPPVFFPTHPHLFFMKCPVGLRVRSCQCVCGVRRLRSGGLLFDRTVYLCVESLKSCSSLAPPPCRNY